MKSPPSRGHGSRHPVKGHQAPSAGPAAGAPDDHALSDLLARCDEASKWQARKVLQAAQRDADEGCRAALLHAASLRARARLQASRAFQQASRVLGGVAPAGMGIEDVIADPRMQLAGVTRLVVMCRQSQAAASLFAAIAVRFDRLRNPWRSAHPGPTFEASARPARTSPTLALYRAGRLDAGQAEAAADIATVYQWIVARLMPRAWQVERGSGGGGAADLSERQQAWVTDVYQPWRRRLSRDVLEIAIDLAVDELSVRACARLRRRHQDTIIAMYAEALDAWIEIEGRRR